MAQNWIMQKRIQAPVTARLSFTLPIPRLQLRTLQSNGHMTAASGNNRSSLHGTRGASWLGVARSGPLDPQSDSSHPHGGRPPVASTSSGGSVSLAFGRKTNGLLNRKGESKLHGGDPPKTVTAAAGPVVSAAAVSVLDAPLRREVAPSPWDERDEDELRDGPSPPQNNNLGKHRALVLDCAYRPINVVSWPKAVMMDFTQKAEVVEYYPPPAYAFSGQGPHQLPAVIRVAAYVDIHEVAGDVSCTRRNVFVRDKFMCQYCGCRGGGRVELTLDHIIPASKGGRNTWLNLVTACMPCNQRKGDKLLQQIGWKLRNVPRKPSPWEIGVVLGLGSGDIARPCREWEPYLEPYRIKIHEIRRQAVEAGLYSAEDGGFGSGDEANYV